MNGSILSKRRTYLHIISTICTEMGASLWHSDPFPSKCPSLMQCLLTRDLWGSWKKNTDSGYRGLPGHTQIKEFVFFVLLMLCVWLNKPHEAQYMFAWVQLFPKFSKAKQKSKLRNINEKLNLSGGLCGCHINMCSLFLRNSHYYIISSLCS